MRVSLGHYLILVASLGICIILWEGEIKYF